MPPAVTIRSDESFERSVNETVGRDMSDTESVFIDSVLAKEFLFLFEAEEKKKYKTTIVRSNPFRE